MNDVYYIQDLEQLKVFSDPFRVKILWEMDITPKTGKMLADQFNIPPSKMRYHLTELERVGLIVLVKTELKNGIQQKFFQPIAKTISLEKISRVLNGVDRVMFEDTLKESAYNSLSTTIEHFQNLNKISNHIIQVTSDIYVSEENYHILRNKIKSIYEFMKENQCDENNEVAKNIHLSLTFLPLEDHT